MTRGKGVVVFMLPTQYVGNDAVSYDRLKLKPSSSPQGSSSRGIDPSQVSVLASLDLLRSPEILPSWNTPLRLVPTRRCIVGMVGGAEVGTRSL